MSSLIIYLTSFATHKNVEYMKWDITMYYETICHVILWIRWQQTLIGLWKLLVYLNQALLTIFKLVNDYQNLAQHSVEVITSCISSFKHQICSCQPLMSDTWGTIWQKISNDKGCVTKCTVRAAKLKLNW